MKEKIKLKWVVGNIPTGKYKSFYNRAWPDAYYKDGNPAIALYCQDEYVPAKVKAADHAEIKICIAFYSNDAERDELGTFVWKTLKRRAKTLKEAKELAEKFINEHPEIYANKKER